MTDTYLEITGDQVLLRDTTARFIRSELPLEQVRLLHDDPRGFSPKWLRRAAEIGWFSLLVGESDGGGSVSGQALMDAAIVAEEIGRGLQPGPFVPTSVVAAAVGRGRSGGRTALREIMAGEAVAAWAFADRAGNWDGGAGVEVTGSGGSLRVSGTRGFVQDAGAADWYMVPGRLDGQDVHLIVSASTPGISVRPMKSLDLGRRMGEVGFDRVEVPAEDSLIDFPHGADTEQETQLMQAVVLNCAETVGATQALLGMTVAYAKERVAFGRPIGSFQALKHVLADQALLLEKCQAGVEAATTAVWTGDRRAPEIASMVSAFVGDASNEIAQQCLQVHGGIGYTWEHDLHLYLRRIRSNAVQYGEPTWHRERLCRMHDLGGPAGRAGRAAEDRA